MRHGMGSIAPGTPAEKGVIAGSARAMEVRARASSSIATLQANGLTGKMRHIAGKDTRRQ
jgi:hypothetical protein